MELEQQVVSLELAKKLKELGVKQESFFWWQTKFSTGKNRLVQNPSTGGDNDDYDWYSAFTVAELGEMLPAGIHSFKANREHFLNKNHENWWCDFKLGGEPSKGVWEGNCFADTEADARAKMLVYLLENKLITL